MSLLVGIFSPISSAFALGPVTTPAFTTVAGGTSVTVTLTGGTYKVAPIVAADFIFGGTNASALALGTFTRTSATVVTITGLTVVAAVDNTVQVLGATQATQAASAAGLAVALTAVTSAAFTTVAGGTSITVTLTGGTYRTGTFAANDFVFGGTNAAALALGTYTLTSSTVITITGVTVAAAVNNTVQVKGPTQSLQSASVAAVPVALSAVTSAAYTTVAGGTSVTVTLTGGTFKTGAIVAADFLFAGTNAAAMALGTFTRTSATLVTITGLTVAAGIDNTVQVKGPTQATQAASVAAAAVALSAVTSPAFTTLVGGTSITITLTGGTYKTGTIVAADFAFGGTNAATLATGTFTRTSATVVTITNLTLVAAADNTVQVLGATEATQAASVAGVAVAYVAKTSAGFTTVAGGTAITATLTGGTYRSGTFSSSDFVFGGPNAAVLATGTFTRTSNTVVTITNVTVVAGTLTNTIQVLGSAQATQATSIAGAAVALAAVTSPAFTTVAGGTSITVTLTGGTYRTGTFAATDFTFAGTNAAALALGTYTLTSSTVITITGVTVAAAVNNTVQVKGPTQSLQSASVAAVPVAFSAVTSSAFTTVAGGTSVTVTLTGGTFKTGAIVAADFVFGGTNAGALALGTFTRTSATLVTITNLTLVAAADNTVQVKGPTQATQAASVAGVAVAYNPITSPTFTTLLGGTSITITLTGGTFRTGTFTAGDFVFGGTNSAALALGTFVRTSNTVVTITNLTVAAAADNTIQVIASAQATQVTSVAGAAVAYNPITSAAFNTSTAGGTSVTITLTGGTFRSGTFSSSDFVFGGSNAAALALGTFTRTSNTVVTITGLTVAVAVNNTVQVIGSAQATQVTSVAGASVALSAVTSPSFASGAGASVVTVTLTGGTFKTGTIVAGDFVFGGTNAAALALGTFTRTSNTVVTITGVTLVSAVNNTVQAKGPTQALQAASIAASSLLTISTANVVVTAPATGAPPQASTSDNGQFTTTIAWSGSPVTFASATVYTATISVVPDVGFTLTGVGANFFTINGSAATSGNLANAGSFTFTFPATKTTISTANVVVTAPVFAATPQTSTTDNGQYSTTIVWSGSPVTFASNAIYTATISVVPDSTFTLTGVGANFFTANGSAATSGNLADTGIFTFTFPITATAHTVIFDNNGGAGSMSSQVNTTSTALTSASFTRTGYTFNNWNTSSDGTGTSFGDGASFPFNADVTLFAQWTINTFVITVTQTANGTISPSTGSVNFGATPTYTFTPSTGYSVASIIIDGSPLSGGALTSAISLGYNFTAVSTTHTVTATYSINSYAVSYDDNGATGGVVPVDGSSPYNFGATVTVLGNSGALVRLGYTFNNWNTAANGSGTSYAINNTFSLPANAVTLYAQWTINSYAVIYNANGATGGAVPIDGLSPYNFGSTITVLGNTGSLVRLGYTFNNWNTAANGSGTVYAANDTFTLSAAAVTLYAQWAINSYSVTYNANSATAGSIPVDGSSPYIFGATVTVLGNTGSLVRTGYTFNNWNTAANGSGTNYVPNDTFTLGAGAVTLYAQWTINSYAVTYNSNSATGGSAPVDLSSPYSFGSTVTVLGNTGALVRTGYTFNNWNTAANGSGNSYAPSDTFTLGAAAVTLYAQWSLNSFAVTYSAGAHGSVTGTVSQLVNYGGSGSLVTAVPNTGYHFVDWSDSVSTASRTEVNVTGAVSVTANFAINTYTINSSAGTDGSISPLGVNNENYGDTPNFAFSPNTGYHVADVLVDGTSVGAVVSYQFAALSANHTISVSFAINTYTVTATAGSNGTLTPAGINNQSFGGTPIFSITPNVGYHIVDVLVDGVSVGAVASYQFASLGASHTITSTFGTNSYSVSYSANGATGGSVPVDPSSPYSFGSTVTVLGNTGSLVRIGYTFNNWNTAANGSGTAYAANDPFSLPANAVTLYAQWVALGSHTVTFNSNGGTGSMSPQVSNITANLNANTFTRPGYTFIEWDTIAIGGGTSYLDGASYPFTADATLYAQWTSLPTHTVTFNGNGADGGNTAPQTYFALTNLTSNGFSFTDHAFLGWNTLPDGKGSSFSNGATYSFALNIIMYAQWQNLVFPHFVFFNKNLSSGDAVSVQGSIKPAPLATATFVRDGYVLTHWNTSSDGTGRNFGINAIYDFDANINLYAQWKLIPTFTVTFNSNAGLGVMSPQVATTASQLASNTFIRTGYKFSGWNSVADGTGTPYGDRANFSFDKDITLFAQWNPNPVHTISYLGGEGASGIAPAQNPVSEGESFAVAANTFTRPGYSFVNWSDGTSNFLPGSTYVMGTAGISFTARWAATITPSTPLETVLPVNSSSTYHVNVVGADGALIPVIVDVPQDTTTLSGSIRIVVSSTPELNSAGQITLNIQILDDFGDVIPTINKALTLHFKSPLGSTVVAESSDGFTWREIPLIPNGGTTIAPGQVDGYYLDTEGNVVVVTSHLTYFGFKKPQTAPISISAPTRSLTLGSTVQVSAAGGSGTAGYNYLSLSPQVCSVSDKGTIKTFKTGNCVLRSIRGGDVEYLSQISNVISLQVVDSQVSAITLGKLKQLSINLGKRFAHKKVSIQYVLPGSKNYLIVTELKLNSVGKIVTKRIVPTGSKLRIRVAGKTVATLEVTGI